MSSSSRSDIAAHREAIAAGRWFGGLPAALQDALLEGAVLHALDTGQRLFARGDAFDGIYSVVRGALRTVGVNENGKEAMLAILEPCSWFGEIALFDGLARTHDVIADQPSLVLRVPKAALEAMLAANPGWWYWFGLLQSQKMRFAFIALEEAALLPAPIRVARRLVYMAEGYGEWQDRSRRVLPLPQDQLASMLSLSRQTINQVLRQLEGQGLVRLSYRELEILDLDGLRRAGNPAAN
ncbi:CRP-like cAMP-binding protein [Fluviicoccus keumensis]|uniref:CRP-like cAMP-binding protein n=1 Tax=Fluviicoccus keumensis TaxID=1435465 RepID=A0A4Q7ZDW6_9GAMM|nr:Crp/Fnr family transcriptional regulator [Fluviicoccus keumensis]RZU48245.1 CRP-like cAMP-binding protein [Fluviicoccus keumensis]